MSVCVCDHETEEQWTFVSKLCEKLIVSAFHGKIQAYDCFKQ